MYSRRLACVTVSSSCLRWAAPCSLSGAVGPLRLAVRAQSGRGASIAAATVLLRQRTSRAAAAATVVSPDPVPTPATSRSDVPDDGSGSDAVPLGTAAEVERAFRCSVEARTVSNAQLRRYVHRLPPKDFALGLAAVAGARAGGLTPNAQVYEALLGLLIAGGQLRASMELYQSMIATEHLTPTPESYALLMELCLQRESSEGCQRLFHDMQKRGMRPSARNYDLMLASLATEVPSKWEQAIEIFDKLNRDRKTCVNADTYNALMRVYLSMQPFDWRVVYNCYHEMRSREPRVPLEWESYLLLREALRRGNAGRVRRFLAFLDAWVQTTPLWSVGFLQGVIVYFAVMWAIKTVIGFLFLQYVEASGAPRGGAGTSGESLLPLN